jgi:signal transduction histidine kinase
MEHSRDAPFFYRLTPSQWVAIDAVTGIGALLTVVFGDRSGNSSSLESGGAGVLVLAVVATVPVVVRRVWPVSVLELVTVATAALTATGRSSLVLDLVVGLAAYSVASRLARRQAIVALVCVELVLGVAVVAAEVRGDAGTDLVHSILTAGACWFVGDSVRARRQYLAGVAEQTRERGIQAVRAERVRIARELHDVVVHGLTVMTIQAGVGRRVMARRPDEAAKALEVIETAGRTAQDELRVILGLLREPDDDRSELAPAPALGDLAALVDTVRAAGLPVQLEVSGLRRELSPAVELSLYRIVQEGLTNVVKHAGMTRTTVRLTFASADVDVEIIDDGRNQERPIENGSDGRLPIGHGLVGMRERVGAFGGSLTAEPTGQGGFRVAARFPAPANR